MVKGYASRLLARLRALPAQSYYTLSGWRFTELAKQIERTASREFDAMLAAVEAPRTAEMRGSARLAIVTCLPPDQTGIANFSARHIPSMGVPVDVFSQVRDVSEFLRLRVVFEQESDGDAKLFPLSSLMSRDALVPYDKVLFALGNSDHNVEVFQQMERLSALGGAERAVCYLHDPCCHNVARLGKGLSPEDYLRYLGRLYGVQLPKAARGLEGGPAVRTAIDAGLYGPRVLHDLGVRHFIVNSKAAAGIVSDDLTSDQVAATRIETLFHPVFPTEVPVRPARGDATLIVGTFGVPGHIKATEVVIQAVERLRKAGKPVRLIIAGYQAFRYVETERFGSDAPWIDVAEPGTERELQLEMVKCDVAVQLRRENLGESSGVVPALIGLGIPTIVSRVGAFAEYGAATHTVAAADAITLAEKVMAVAGTDDIAPRAYAQRHTMEQFNSDLLAALDTHQVERVAQSA